MMRWLPSALHNLLFCVYCDCFYISPIPFAFSQAFCLLTYHSLATVFGHEFPRDLF